MKRHPRVTASEAAHRYALRVYYEDTDAGGVVYHANYLRFAERARTEAMRGAGASHAAMTQETGLIFVVCRAEVDYLAPAHVDDSLIVLTRPHSVRAAQVVIEQSIVRADAPDRALAELRIDLACIRAADGRPARIPPRWRDALAGTSGE
ncbi:MAG: tol-pal system-associated acyl-CoA thioesterase [Acetobacteraceae bacterium]|nr:tol-pal system-associated acyl-CoA thioesterase [Acetobacteraceae bacterium]